MEATLDAIPHDAATRTSLVAAARLGDHEAFGHLVDPELARALGTSIVLTRSHADAEDAVQEALLAAWQGLDRLRDPGAFGAWFRTHIVRSAIRVAKRRGRVLETNVEAPAPPGELDRALERRQLGRAFDRLALEDRVLLTVRYLWDASVAETSSVLGVPVGTVKSRSHAALQRLRAAYDAEARR